MAYRRKYHHCEICSIRGKDAKAVSYSLSDVQHSFLKEQAAVRNMTLSSLVRHILYDFLYDADTLSLNL